MFILLILCALVIVTVLAFYAGSLLFKLRQQRALQESRRIARAKSIIQSVQTIAMAMSQQQCNLSEGCIRLIHLLESIPEKNKPDYRQKYSGIYTLYAYVKDLPTHDARRQLSKSDRKTQDSAREEKEAQLEPLILKDVEAIRAFFSAE
jgi:ERCC4-related helicase